MIYIGIDPGLSGAVALINANDDLLLCDDLPIMASGAKATIKNMIDPAALRALLLSQLKGELHRDVRAVVEKTSAAPGQGVASMFSMGDTLGCCRSVLACLGISTVLVAPATWKKHMGLTKDKEQSRARAILRWPTAVLSLKRHHDRAESLLLAAWLRETHQGH